MSDAVRRYGEVSRAYALQAQQYAALAEAAAEAEAEAKHEKAKFKVRARSSGQARSDADAETQAEADPDIARLLHARLLTAAQRDAANERLKQLRSQLDFGRSVVSQEREQDRLHAAGGPLAPT